MLRLLVICMACFLSLEASALTSTKHFCQILIHLEKVNGENQNVQFTSPLKTKEECRALAQIHRKNFDPDKIKLKRVSFVWKKSTKSIPMLAKVKGKKQKPFKRAKWKSRRS